MRVFKELSLSETGRSAAAVASKSLTKSRMLRNRFFGGCISLLGSDTAMVCGRSHFNPCGRIIYHAPLILRKE